MERHLASEKDAGLRSAEQTLSQGTYVLRAKCKSIPGPDQMRASRGSRCFCAPPFTYISPPVDLRLARVPAGRHVPCHALDARALRGSVSQLGNPPVHGLRHPAELVGVALALLAQAAIGEPLIETLGLKHSGSSSFVVFLGGVALQSPVLVSGRLPASIGRHGGQ